MVEATGARRGMSLLPAISARGHMRFGPKEKGGVNATLSIAFPKRLIAGAKHEIFLIAGRDRLAWLVTRFNDVEGI
ncbi:MAG: hypothetical protein WBG11_12980 [Methylocella sp.]